MAADSVVARRYARALFEAAVGAGVIAEVGRDLGSVVDALWADQRGRGFFLSDRVPAEAKKRLLTELLERLGVATHSLARNFLSLTVDKRREAILPEVVEVYEALADKAAGVADVEVRTAVALGQAERERLEGALGAKLGRRVRLTFRVEPALVGGVQLRLEDRLLDASVRRRLERLKEHLAKAR